MKLKSITVEAETVSSAMEKVSNPAGKKELDYVLAHPDEFPKMKDGDYYFFFGAVDDGLVPYLHWFGGRFYVFSNRLGVGWYSSFRAVLRDLDVELDSGSDLTLKNLILDLKKLLEKYSV